MTSITLPIATVSEAEALKALAIEAFTPNFTVYGHYPPGLESLEWHKKQIKNGHCHKIMQGDTLVGGIYLLLLADGEMQIDFFFIGEKYQGQKIGTFVIVSIEKEYADVKKWRLYSPFKDYRNHSFYEKHGYIKAGEIKPMEQNEFTLFQYEKQP